MRAIVIWIAIMAAMMTSIKAEAVSQIKANLEKLQAASTGTTGVGGESIDQLAIETKRIIQLYVRDADSNDWATASPERLKRLGQVADAVQPYTSLLVELGTPSSAEQGSQNALNLLYYARPTKQLKEELLELANVPKPRGAARAAYDIIFNLGMDTPDVREAILARMAEYQPESYKSSAAAEVFYSAGGEWRIEGSVPFYVALLQSEYRNKDELNGRVRAVADAVRGLGPKAADVLPLLQQQLARMKAENADFRDITVIEGAIRAIESKKPIEPLLSVNGAGPVGANPLPKSSAPTPAATAAQDTPGPAAATPVRQPEVPAAPTPWTETKSAPSGFLIVPVAILAAVILGILLYLVRRRSP